MSIEYCPTKEMLRDFFTKPLQGSLFWKLRALIMNLPEGRISSQLQKAQECVEAEGADGPLAEECFSAAGKRTYAEVAKVKEDRSSSK